MSVQILENSPIGGGSPVEEVYAREWLESALAGDFTAAWSASDRIREAGFDYSRKERWCRSLWNGSSIGGRPVLLRCWRGLGDAIHFIRFAPLVRAKATRLTVEAPRELLRLFGTIPEIDQLHELDQINFQSEDFLQIESTELPYVFRTTLDSIPRKVPYIHLEGQAPPRTVGELKIGLCWCGGSYDPRRAISLLQLEPLLRVPEACFFQLQRGPALSEMAGSGFKFRNGSDRSMDLYESALLINTLDIIVSVDTMIAHLAGALGKRVFLLLHAEADWRWMRGRQDSPWYPTMSLLRQSQAGNWDPVVAQAVSLLTNLVTNERARGSNFPLADIL